ncbi:tRNA(fMet)-specific endonuclease VapC [Algoriphagus sp. 4150]|uniref:type II toxin-antitoxin system VapC family toxin n=1 Tax=Algoriphagus sp. 4150 TaxID=2817756 RepID=UPI0028678D51|nr:type II toxin-antitoxin system VapC family toxin [Algoriphagus sp. 4150]MDR7130820.1 tRNA(fMet)-specific endonuclease VapC [Algoriphagus sp. 4150]
MKYLLDTNICIHFLRGKFGLIKMLQEIGTENCSISEITLAELVFGAENSTNPKKNLELIEVFTNQVVILPIFNAIYLYAKEKARLRSKGLMISDFDLLIGCTSVEKDLIMVTENLKEFERISGIVIENWVKR